MNLIFNEIIALIGNIMIFTIIPLIWYLIRHKKVSGFLGYIGIIKSKNIKPFKTIIIIIFVYIITLAANIIVIKSGNSQRNISGYENTSLFIIIIVFILYGLKTGIAEEIFFRGFIAKRLFAAVGFKLGNIIQAIIFAIPHIVINGSASLVDIIVRIINAFLLGYTFGYVMKYNSKGSIIPIMIAHTCINIFSSSIFYIIL